MVFCTGRGANGYHCCYIDGKVCQFLVEGDTPRCSIWGKWDESWQAAPVGQWFARTYPGFTCADWPQNISEVMTRIYLGVYALCCWSSDGNLG